MIAFDKSGSLKWSVPNDSPQMATADGGVIGASGVTYDNQGRATGRTTLPIQAWTGNGYALSSNQVVQVSMSAPIPATPPAWSVQTGNLSQSLTSPFCHDDRDQFTVEYVNFKSGFVPSCFQFLSPTTYAVNPISQNTNFGFDRMNQDDIVANDHPGWALLFSPMLYGAVQVQANYGQTIVITSGYRSPKVQSPHGHPHDRHLHGDAVDIRAGNEAIYIPLREAGLNASNACVEPLAQAIRDGARNPYDHVHVDWRIVAPDHQPCPQAWRQ